MKNLKPLLEIFEVCEEVIVLSSRLTYGKSISSYVKQLYSRAETCYEELNSPNALLLSISYLAFVKGKYEAYIATMQDLYDTLFIYDTDGV